MTKQSTVTLTKSALVALIAQAIAESKAESKAANVPASREAKSERSVKNEIATVKAFKKAGFGNVTPHVDVMTFNRWMAQGFRPVEGSKATKVKNLRLFHKSQVRALTPEEKAAAAKQNADAVAKYDAANRSSTDNAKATQQEVYQG